MISFFTLKLFQFYDDEEDEINDQERSNKEDDSTQERFQQNEPKYKLGKARPKVKNALSNL